MSTQAFPVLFFNMSGEMIYIVEQRLTAQSIDRSKADKVINDIFMAVFNPGLIVEIFKRQQLLTVYVMRQMFEKLAHSSIMKLNEQSMNKLFDLMVMVSKYQMVVCNTPIDVINLTLNHFNSMCEMSKQEQTLKLIEDSKEKFLNYYLDMNWAQLQHIRYTILTFLQDIKTRVSIFLRDGTQENDGNFVIKPIGVVSCDCQIPGTIKYFNDKNEVKDIVPFPSLGQYIVSNEKTTLGFNIYTKDYSQKELMNKQTTEEEQLNESTIRTEQMSKLNEKNIQTNDSIKNELFLLAKLIGRDEPNEPGMDFWLNLGNDDTIAEITTIDRNSHLNELNISEGIHKNKSLENIINDLNVNENEDNVCETNEDLLALMDS